MALAAMPSQQAVDVVEAVVAGSQKLGLPRFLRMDHALSCRGSTRHSRSFSLLIRFCLYLGVEVVFIPAREPWRNGMVERFNDVYDQLCCRPQQFRDVAHVREELSRFETFHTTQQRDAKRGQRPPWEMHRP